MSSLMEMMYTYTLTVNGHVLCVLGSSTAWIVTGVAAVLLALVVVILVLVVRKYHIPLNCNKGSPVPQRE